MYRDGVAIGSSTTTKYTDSTVAASTSYVYAVTAVKLNTASAPSTADLAPTFFCEDDPVIATQTHIRATHVLQLRTAVNIVRARAGLAAAVFTDSTLTNLRPKVVHIAELRTALSDARSELAIPAIVYVHPSLTAGNIIYSAEVGELRGGVK